MMDNCVTYLELAIIVVLLGSVIGLIVRHYLDKARLKQGPPGPMGHPGPKGDRGPVAMPNEAMIRKHIREIMEQEKKPPPRRGRK